MSNNTRVCLLVLISMISLSSISCVSLSPEINAFFKGFLKNIYTNDDKCNHINEPSWCNEFLKCKITNINSLTDCITTNSKEIKASLSEALKECSSMVKIKYYSG